MLGLLFFGFISNSLRLGTVFRKIALTLINEMVFIEQGLLKRFLSKFQVTNFNCLGVAAFEFFLKTITDLLTNKVVCRIVLSTPGI